MRRVKIFDTTLRDGEQAPGASLNTKEKIEIAQQLARLKADIIEAGFPASSRGDFEAVRAVGKAVREPVICGLARCIRGDVEAAGRALLTAKRRRIHTFISTSDIHIQKQLRKNPEEVLGMAVAAVRLARKFTDDVEFSPMDATRSRMDFMARVVEAAVREGATTVNIPDTVGYSTPAEFGKLIGDLLEMVPALRNVAVSVHCHNDLGLAVANSLAGVEAGASQVECSVNGIGERAGNASLEEIVMTLRTRRGHYDCETAIRTEEIVRTSRLVARLTGMQVQPNKAIVGANAFAHESGIHQDGVLKGRETYEIMTPESVGLTESRLVLGKHSGRHMLARKLEELGMAVPAGKLNRIYEKLMALADKKKHIYDEDVMALVEDETGVIAEVYRLEDLEISSGLKKVPLAVVTLSKGRKKMKAQGRGDGPVDATYKAVDRITGLKPRLLDYGLRAISAGKDAQGEVTVRIRGEKGREAYGRGASTDVIEASAKAYVDAVNRLLHKPPEKKKGALDRL